VKCAYYLFIEFKGVAECGINVVEAENFQRDGSSEDECVHIMDFLW
jgi:hypothetical protein